MDAGGQTEFISHIKCYIWTQLKRDLALLSKADWGGRMQESCEMSVPPAGRRPSLELWRSDQPDKQMSPPTWSSPWRGEDTQVCIGGSEGTKVCRWLTHFCGATAEGSRTAAGRWVWGSPPRGRSLVEKGGGDCSDYLLWHRHFATTAELTVAPGPDGDAGRLSGPPPAESAHRQHVLPAGLQTLHGDGLPSGVRHRHVEQIWWTDEPSSNTW